MKNIYLFPLLFLLALLPLFSVSAAKLNYAEGTAPVTTSPAVIDNNPLMALNYLRYFFFFIFAVSSITALTFLTINASKYYSKSTTADKQESYKKMLNSVIGLVLIIVSLAVIKFIYPDVISFKELTMPNFFKYYR
jgi:uncharacterized membrane protein